MRFAEILDILGLRKERVKVGDRQLEKLGYAALGGKDSAQRHRTNRDENPFSGVRTLAIPLETVIIAPEASEQDATQQSL